MNYISESSFEALRSGKVQLNDSLFCLRGSLGKVGMVRDISRGGIASSLVIVRPEPQIHPGFINYYLRSPLATTEIEKHDNGSAQPNLAARSLGNFTLPLPPALEQQRIADKLDTVLARVDAVNDRLARVAPLLKRYRQAVLAAATSGRLTADWRVIHASDDEWPLVSLGAVAADFSYGSSAKSAKDGDVPVLRMGNIQDGRLDWSDLVFTSDRAEVEKYMLRNGDVLFNRTNSPELVGKAAVYKGEQHAIYAGYLIRVRCTDQLLPDYLNYCLGSPRGREYCWAVKSDGVSQSNINAKKLAAFTFALPEVAEQTEIVRRADILFAFANRLEARLQAAQTAASRLTPALLAKAFRGELVPQDPADEPAAELLKRLAASQTSAPQSRKGRRPAHP